MHPLQDGGEIEELQGQLKMLNERSEQLDDQISTMVGNLQGKHAEPAFKERAYVTDEDIKDLEGFADRTVMVIKAPKGTKMALPYPDAANDENPGYQIYLQSPAGPVDIYVVNMVDEAQSQQGCDGNVSRSVKDHEGDHQAFMEYSGDDHHCLDHDSGFSDFYVCPSMD